MGDQIDLAVVTAAWGSYGKYLPEWLDSIANQTVLPSQVVIVNCGVETLAGVRPRLKALAARGVKTILTRKRLVSGMGEAMNRAVAKTDTEWVIRLDADDLLLPHAIEDVAALAPAADVVCIGAIRDGKEVLFPNTSAEWILAGRQGSMSPSAFRRSFWEQHPYIEHNDWIESAFWVGLAHLDARFVPTPRAGFVYRQHEDSHSHTISKADKQAARQQQLELCAAWAH